MLKFFRTAELKNDLLFGIILLHNYKEDPSVITTAFWLGFEPTTAAQQAVLPATLPRRTTPDLIFFYSVGLALDYAAHVGVSYVVTKGKTNY